MKALKPVLLDIGCRQGGATRGYRNAGFFVIGVDIEPQPRYCGDAFIQADGLAVLDNMLYRRHARLWLVRHGQVQVDAVHTSWPCQGYSNTHRIRKNDHPRLIEDGRELLDKLELPYIQENVEGAPLLNPVTICGATLGLHTYRHRLFEANFPITAPEHQPHVQQQIKMGRPVREGDFYQAVGNFSNVDYVRRDMGVEWMTREGIRECVPPVYTEHIGRQLIRAADLAPASTDVP